MDNNNLNNPNSFGNGDYSAPSNNDYVAPEQNTNVGQNTYAQQNNAFAAQANDASTVQQNTYTAQTSDASATQTNNAFTAQQNTYTTQQNAYSAPNNNMYGNQGNYTAPTNNAFGNSMYANQMPPVGKNGNPVKNNFGMKLTFSILEILSCCLSGCFGLITTVLGIIACVFTCQANSAYKRADWDTFEKKRKSSTVLLWVGLPFEIIGAIAAFIFGLTGGIESLTSNNDTNSGYESFIDEEDEDDYDYDYDYDDEDDVDDVDDVDDSSSNNNSSTVVGYGDIGTIYEIIPADMSYEIGGYDEIYLEGYVITFPALTSDFLAAGFSFSGEDPTNYVINPGDYDLFMFDSRINPDESIGWVYVYNNTDVPMNAIDLPIAGIDVESDQEYNGYVPEMKTIYQVTFGIPAETAIGMIPYEADVYQSDDLDWTTYTYYGDEDDYVEISYRNGYFDELKIRCKSSLDNWD